MKNIDQIRKDLQFLAEREVVLFGSFIRGEIHPRSDIDVAIITHSHDRDEQMQIRIEMSGRAPKGYDIQVFEALPLVIRGAIIEEFEVLYGDPLEIGMYLYHARKFWDDYQHRIQVPTLEEIRRGTIES